MRYAENTPGPISKASEILKNFIQKQIRITHVYQPVMLKTLLGNTGRATIREVASAFLAHDESQIEYYEHITKQILGKDLKNHGFLERQGQHYALSPEFAGLSATDRRELIALCEAAVEAYKAKRAKTIRLHQTSGLGADSGKLRYLVLKRAGFHCELCGVSADERALEVDHILPKKHGGSDELENFQALCWKCKANKGAGDNTNFKEIRESYDDRVEGCRFCEVIVVRMVGSNALSYAIRDGNPVTPLHTLIIPQRHVESFFDLHGGERNALFALLDAMKSDIQHKDDTIEGFNVGVNNGEAAGQSVPHVHVHLIPRRRGDVENPRGGVRGVIPRKASY
jgi:diadenosine tetraphosphate (Ap4A) HIT family hydrolase/5-methylcytosine-specific restriction endonuclease McrA